MLERPRQGDRKAIFNGHLTNAAGSCERTGGSVGGNSCLGMSQMKLMILERIERGIDKQDEVSVKT
jgi:hypothetical protein